MKFGRAIEYAKNGLKVARKGWNGRGMFVYLNPGSLRIGTVAEGGLINGVREDLFQTGSADTALRMPNLNLRAPNGSTITGWLASQTDILAEDWQLVD